MMAKHGMSFGLFAAAAAVIAASAFFEIYSNNRRGEYVETKPVATTEKPAADLMPRSVAAPQGVPGTGAIDLREWAAKGENDEDGRPVHDGVRDQRFHESGLLAPGVAPTGTGRTQAAQSGSSQASHVAAANAETRRLQDEEAARVATNGRGSVVEARPAQGLIAPPGSAGSNPASVPQSSRTRPVHPPPYIRRVSDWHCEIVAEGSIGYMQGCVLRAPDAYFPCPSGMARDRWGSGTRTIRVLYPQTDGVMRTDGGIELVEIWPEATP